MAKPLALIITGYGINCEEETAKVFENVGAESKIMHINDIISNKDVIENFQIMAFPGGFSYGDDTGSGNAMANKIRNNMMDELLKFVTQDKLVIGVCNGFQILTNLGLVPATKGQYGKREAVLMTNSSNRYECRWVHVKSNSKKCIWSRNIDLLHLPVAHGEGNFYCEPEILKQLKDNDQIVWKYVREDGSPANLEFPINPNGAMEDIAGICDESGRILGMMPHPERFNAFTNEDGWELKKEALIREGKELPTQGLGIAIFKNAVEYFK